MATFKHRLLHNIVVTSFYFTYKYINIENDKAKVTKCGQMVNLDERYMEILCNDLVIFLKYRIISKIKI